MVVNSYVDFDDYENVIKTYNDERFFYKLSGGITKRQEIYVRKNYVNLNDGFFQIGQTEKKEFYNVENSKTDVEIDHRNYKYARISIKMESREDTYERTVFSVFDYTGLIGGVFEIFEILGGFVVGYFTKNLFMFYILSNLYRVQKNIDDQECSREQTESHGIPLRNETSQESERMNGTSSSEEEKSDGQSREEESASAQVNLNETWEDSRNQFLYEDRDLSSEREEFTELKQTLKNRFRYGFKWKDYIYEIF